ncbi:PAS domain-containing protein [Archangium lipolyticum]|uniref:PAS domain-containing protein n=1 Tax=Archangium lipolyticum TaxID=2970465 RepID=UPI00214A407E|nr:PAS domain-containing protein [Archangium lipolyticum]
MMSAAPLSAQSSLPQQARILLVEDSPNQLLAMEALLSPLGQEVLTASSGGEALRLLLEKDCALVLLDVHLPDISGFEVARLMRERERSRRTPIIFVTGMTADPYFTSQGYALGAVDFLFKPFDPLVLRAKAEVFVELFLHRERLKEQAEREQAELERSRLLGLLVQTPAAIAITRGPEFIFEFANPLYEKVLGRPVVLGKPLREVMPEILSQPGVMEALRHAMRTGEPFVGREFPVALDRRGDGHPEEAFFDLVYQPLLDDQGQVEWLLTHAVEVTEQVNARRRLETTEQALRQREAEYRRLADNIPDLVARFDRQHRLLYVNRRIERTTGQPAESFLGRTSEELGLPPDRVESASRAISEAFQGEAASLSFDLSTSEGLRHYDAHLVPERDERDAVVSVLAVTRDVTESRNRERALRESEGRFRLLAEAGELLSSLDDAAVLQRLAELFVPRLADWVTVDLLSPSGAVERVVSVHRDPEKVSLAFEIARRWPIDKNVHGGVAQVLRTGEPVLVKALTDEALSGLTRSEEHLRVGRALGLTSTLLLPLEARGRVLGVLSLSQAESGRHFTEEDIPLARELARRAGLAVDNALLYREAREAQGRASRLQAVAAALSRAATPEEVARAILTEGLLHAGTHAGVVFLQERDGSLRSLHDVGYPEEFIRRLRHIPPGERTPYGDVVLAEEAHWFTSAEELTANYPSFAWLSPIYQARVGLPLRVEERSLGCLWLSFPDKRSFPPEERDFLVALGQLCAQALSRASRAPA